MHHSEPISGSWLEWAALHPYEREGRREPLDEDAGQEGRREEGGKDEDGGRWRNERKVRSGMNSDG